MKNERLTAERAADRAAHTTDRTSKRANARRCTVLPALVIAAAGLALTATTAGAQGLNVDLLSIVPGYGNDCWGYVSPSGREYALAGNDNDVTFIDITSPTSPVVLAVIPHVGSGWSDIKTYKQYAYSVAESTGSGIHVYDLTDIDNGNVTLVQNIASVGRSHNIAIDTDSGYLYTLGSRNSTGTTTCWDLADPANPVQVGGASVTSSYQHDAQIVTYTSGPYAGKQILFGCAGGTGLQVYDVTDKNVTNLLSTTVYPQIAYCHQGWLSEDRNYFYVNDELDENNFGITTRTLIFDVSDLANPVLANTFTTGLGSIDHNLYWKDGFLFEANYTSGLRVIDACTDPLNLTETGYYDTYPSSNGGGSNGAWGCYPFFPSGVCLINNNNGDLYIVNPAAAVTGVCGPTCYADCDPSTGAGVLDIFDFLCFQDSFVGGNTYACDCDTSTGQGVCDIFDFLCFQDAFVAGCP